MARRHSSTGPILDEQIRDALSQQRIFVVDMQQLLWAYLNPLLPQSVNERS
jgi:hypothetical protein